MILDALFLLSVNWSNDLTDVFMSFAVTLNISSLNIYFEPEASIFTDSLSPLTVIF